MKTYLKGSITPFFYLYNEKIILYAIIPLINKCLMEYVMKSIDEILKKYWGYDNFRDGQREIIESALSGNDTMAIMPTGGGKSLCFQIPALTEPDRVTLVISPLVALMNDQVQDLNKRGVNARKITNEISFEEQCDIINDVKNGKVTLLYLSPERLSSEKFREDMMSFDIRQIVIDEAHCISQWSQDFRPSYRNIFSYFKEYEEKHPNGRLTRLALTATANEKAQKDIIDSMQIKNENTFIRGFSRPNLEFKVLSPKDKIVELTRLVQLHRDDKILIYASSREKTMTIATKLRNLGVESSAFHAGMSKNMKDKVLEDYRESKLRVVVATNAFGMGIDIPDIRHVIHHDMPGSMEAYYQEAGRAGRDQQHAECVLLSAPAMDQKSHNFRIEMQYPEKEVIQTIMDQMASFYVNDPVFDLEPVIIETLVPGVKNFKIKGALNFLEREGWLEKIIDTEAHNPYDSNVFSINIDKEIEWDRLDKSRKDAIRNLSVMFGYVRTNQCRQKYICQFFEGKLKEHDFCGQCDLCKSRNNEIVDDYTKYAIPLLTYLKTINGRNDAPTRKELVQFLISNTPSAQRTHESQGAYNQCTYDQINKYIFNLQKDLVINFSDDYHQRVYLSTQGEKCIQNQATIISRPPEPLLGNFDKRFLPISNKEESNESSLNPQQKNKLIDEIVKVRNYIAKQYSISPIMVLSKNSIEGIVLNLPSNESELLSINGINKARLKGCEPLILKAVSNYINKDKIVEKSEDDKNFEELGLNI